MDNFVKHVDKVNAIFKTIRGQENAMLVQSGTSIELANSEVLSDCISKMAVLLDSAVDPLYDAMLIYRQTKAAKRDQFLATGMKKSPAKDELEFDKELIQMGNAVHRCEAHIERCQQVIMTIQTKIKVQTGMAKGDL